MGEAAQQRRWDIFCAVVDNLGDIGVTWRLARQLAREWSLEVRLWVDDLGALRRLWPAATEGAAQLIEGVDVRHWPTPFPTVEPADVVIEAFGCELPDSYRTAMRARRERGASPVWINLEYLSAESWVEECHALASPQPDGLAKHFFFPGFTPRTGGLIRDQGLLEARDTFQATGARQAFLADLGVDVAGSLVSLFCYPAAPLGALLDALAAQAEPWHCLVPEGAVLKPLAELLGCRTLEVGAAVRRGSLTVQPIPFLRQDRYDRLLWSCDLNLVRGEDSLVRAIWAGKPLIWHIYQQEEGAHWPKLDAFLGHYLAGAPPALSASVRQLWQAWNAGGSSLAGVDALSGPQFAAWRGQAERWCGALARREDLAAGLVQFCANRV